MHYEVPYLGSEDGSLVWIQGGHVPRVDLLDTELRQVHVVQQTLLACDCLGRDLQQLHRSELFRLCLERESIRVVIRQHFRPLHLLYFRSDITRKGEYKINTQLNSYNQFMESSKRVEFKGQLGTVLFEGKLQHEAKNQDPEEIWLGVEWDKANTGKHQGLVEGVQYFTTKKQGDCGSLIKKSKAFYGHNLLNALLQQYFKDLPAEFFTMLESSQSNLVENLASHVQALCVKYKASQAQGKEIAVEMDDEAYVETFKKHKKKVEFYGFDAIWTKLGNLKNIREVSLSSRGINSFCEKGILSQMFHSLKELSLEANLLHSWDQVYFLGNELRELEELSLSGNRLALLQDSQGQTQVLNDGVTHEIDVAQVFSSLKTLVVNDMDLDWKALEMLLGAFSKVNNWIMLNNRMNDKALLEAIAIERLQNIKYFNLENNGVESMESIHYLGEIKGLERLTLKNNRLEEVGVIPSGTFQNLTWLSIEENRFTHCRVITQLLQFPLLEKLYIRKNPIEQVNGQSYIRDRCIGELPHMKMVNGSDLKKYEKKDCEVFYLRRTFEDFFKASGKEHYDYSIDDFYTFIKGDYGRIEALIKKYGCPYETASKAEYEQKKSTTNLKILKFTIMTGKMLGKHKAMKFPQTATVKSVKILVAKMFKLKKDKLVLKYKNSTNTQQVMKELENDEASLIECFADEFGDIIVEEAE